MVHGEKAAVYFDCPSELKHNLQAELFKRGLGLRHVLQASMESLLPKLQSEPQPGEPLSGLDDILLRAQDIKAAS